MSQRASASGRSWAAVTRRQPTRRPVSCLSTRRITSTRISPAALLPPPSTTTVTSRHRYSATLAGDRSYRLARSFSGNQAQIRSRPSCSATRARSAHSAQPLRSTLQVQCNGPRALLRRRRPCPRLHSRVTLLSRSQASHDRHTASSNRAPTLEPLRPPSSRKASQAPPTRPGARARTTSTFHRVKLLLEPELRLLLQHSRLQGRRPRSQASPATSGIASLASPALTGIASRVSPASIASARAASLALTASARAALPASTGIARTATPVVSASARAAFASCSRRPQQTSRLSLRRYRHCSPASGSVRAVSG